MTLGKVLLIGGLLLIVMIILSSGSKKLKIKNYQPLHYDIKIRLYAERNIFIGECNSTIRVNRKITDMYMQSNFGLELIFLIGKKAKKRAHVPRCTHYKNRIINLHFDAPFWYKNSNRSKNYRLPRGVYTLKMTYMRMIFNQKSSNKYYAGANRDQV